MPTTHGDTTERERVAERLLAASHAHAFDPITDVDWDAPLVDGAFFLPEHRVSLYGTPTWERMSERQRIDLSRHEVASMASVGIWFEVVLMQLLVRHVYDRPLTSRHVQYAFMEIAEECRHSTMFGRLIDKLECPEYGPGRYAHTAARAMKTFGSGVQAFAMALIAEEVLDTMQREMMADETLQPITRRTARIHVVEEARHVRYARDEVARGAPHMSAAERAITRLALARAAHIIATRLIHPDVYAAVGLDPIVARRVARANPHRRETLGHWSKRLIAFYDEHGLLGGPGLRLWRASGLMGRQI
ncbi:diiron oxygenase [Embleya sp. NBC_00896]|uniref:AurF N-oxygenase family protein n=1 Tax=Embleya sp. NBC_00896 TaxID=2975961 RepID=UPI00386B3373|nr:diiron oxygenase [Embleya sp. NBC_00896]